MIVIQKLRINGAIAEALTGQFKKNGHFLSLGLSCGQSFFTVSVNTPMTSNVNTKPMTHPAKASAIVPRPEVARSPSVPISVYREVASELQSTRTSLNSLKGQNDDLVQRNQQLRLEIERVVQSALYLRQLADINVQAGTPATNDFSSPIAETSLATTNLVPSVPLNHPSAATPAKNALKQLTGFPGKLFAGQPSQPAATPTQVEAKEIGAWWLVLVICMIIVTAFGTGFLIVRPLLPSR